MATGIIAVGAFQQGIDWLARTLLWVDVGFYLALWVAYVLRLVRYRDRFIADLTSHQRGPAFLTMVAGAALGGGLEVGVPAVVIAAAVALAVLAAANGARFMRRVAELFNE